MRTTSRPTARRCSERLFDRLLLDLLALLWPCICVACGAPDREFCRKCRLELRSRSVHEHDGLGVPCYVAGDYAGALRRVLVAYKHAGAFGFSRPLGERLGAPLRRACAQAARDPPLGAHLIVVPLPSRRRAVRRRGYRHVDEIVRVALAAEGIRLRVLPALVPVRGRSGQVGLDAAARERNARRIAVRRGWIRDYRGLLRGAEVVLVDDIVTTGATMRAARDALEAAGAEVVACAALCGVAAQSRRAAEGRHSR